MKRRLKVVAIVGPTCTGKTALSLHLARRFPCEIICCDSRNIYKYLDLASAKPGFDERKEVPHHLIDVQDPDQEFSAADYARLGALAIEEISSRDRLPVVCGGTGFYARALLEGLSMPTIAPDKDLRALLREEEEREEGSLHRRLSELDPASAERLNPKDLFRLIRALEVCIKSGKPFSELAGNRESPYEVLWIGLTIKDRQKLKTLIAARLEEQIQEGMLAELKYVLSRFGRSRVVQNTVNYRDLLKYLDGELDWEAALEECRKHNYQLARRQIMWFKNNESVHWFFVDEEKREKIELAAEKLLAEFLSQ